MNHIRKVHSRNTCLLASVCMLEGLKQEEYDPLELEFYRLEGTKSLRELVIASAELTRWSSQAYAHWREWGKGYFCRAAPWPKDLHLGGRGLLLIWHWFGTGHAMAYRDGVIYDPDAVEPLPTSVWCSRNPGWEIVSRTCLGRKEKLVPFV